MVGERGGRECSGGTPVRGTTPLPRTRRRCPRDADGEHQRTPSVSYAYVIDNGGAVSTGTGTLTYAVAASGFSTPFGIAVS